MISKRNKKGTFFCLRQSASKKDCEGGWIGIGIGGSRFSGGGATFFFLLQKISSTRKTPAKRVLLLVEATGTPRRGDRAAANQTCPSIAVRLIAYPPNQGRKIIRTQRATARLSNKKQKTPFLFSLTIVPSYSEQPWIQHSKRIESAAACLQSRSLSCRATASMPR